MALGQTFPTQLATGLPIVDTRLINAGQICRDAAGNPRLGVLPAHTGALVVGTAGMNYSVGGFVAAGSRTGVGVEFVANDGATAVATTAAPGANSRIDVIYWRPQFAAAGDGGNSPVFGVVQGNAAVSPVEPAIPAGAYKLAAATILSTTTATNTVVISQAYQYTAMTGGIVIVRNATELAAWAPAAGGKAFNLADNRTYTRVVTSAAPAGAWLPDRAMFLGRRQATQNLGAGWNGLSAAFGAADINDLGTWTPANGTLQVTHAGIYRVGANVRFGSQGNLAVQITQNSGNPDVGVIAEEFVASTAQSLSVHGEAVLGAGDILRVLGYTSVANTVDTTDRRGLQLSVELVALG